jgi:hypothetical protein
MEIYNCAILYLLIYLCSAILYLLKPVYLHQTEQVLYKTCTISVVH